jgi:ParB family chromosome partitioning protein
MTSTTTARTKKQAFDHARNSMWSIDPDDLCIRGGKVLPKDEQGSLDTEEDEDDPLYDVRLHEPLTEEFVNNIYAVGVDTPIIIAKIDDLPTVVAGRSRVRAARLANKKRKAKGEPLIKVDCKMKRDSDTGLMGTMISENEARRDDDMMTKIVKAKRYLNKGVSPEDAAIRFNVSLATFKNWLAFDDNALAATKKAVETGKVSVSAAMTLARIKEPEKQKEALDELMTHVAAGGRSSPRAAKIAAAGAGSNVITGVTDKRTLKKLLDGVQNTPHPHNTSEKTLAWWEGAEDMLKMVIGEKDVDERLKAVLKQVYADAKAAQKAKK